MLSFKIHNSFLDLSDDVDQLIGQKLLWNLDFLKAMETSQSVGKDSGWDPRALCVYDANNLIGFVPMFIKHHSYGEYVFDWSWAEAYAQLGLAYFPKLFIGLPFTPVNSKKIITQKDTLKREIIKFIENFIEKENLSSAHYVFSENNDSINDIFRNKNWSNRKTIQYLWRNKEYKDFDHFLSILKHDKRKKIKQDRKKISSFNLSFQIIEDDQITTEVIDFFYQCYSMTYHQHGSIPYIKKEFFDEFFVKHSDRVVIFCGMIGGQRVGSSFCLKLGDSLYGRYWGAIEYIPALHFELSYYQGIEYCIRNKIEKFYAGIQGEHKLSRGFEPLFSDSFHFLKDERLKKAVSDFAKREGNLHQQYLNELESRVPFKD